jgi:hypothetical protein
MTMTKTKTPRVTRLFTLWDARKEKYRADAKLFAREDARQAREEARLAAWRAKFTPPAGLHPAIGILTNANGLRFYAHVGPDRVYTEGTVEALTALLTSETGR